MRMVAGPNGSGKSTLIELLKDSISFGVYINADDIETALKKKPALHFSDFSIETTSTRFNSFIKKKETIGTELFKQKIANGFLLESNILSLKIDSVDSYLASLIADFIRHELLLQSQDFSFETVMSHPSKITTLVKANGNGYRTYLYFIATDDPSINYERIEGRVLKGGHNVNKKKSLERYMRSLSLLPKAIKESL